MRCRKCGNKIKEMFIRKDKDYICRRCLMYKESDVSKEYNHGKGEYSLTYELTFKQKAASEFLLSNIKNGRDCILNAVTGSGKTEIIYEVIKYCVDNKLTVGIVIPRKDVVIELFNRIKSNFVSASVVKVHGGCNRYLYADIVILTSHQLYRYCNYFDVVIIDEVDAFPFYNNEILNNFLVNSKRGNIVYMSATVNKELLNKVENVYYLNSRYHNHKLDIPKVKYLWGLFMINCFIKQHVNSIVLVYFPTIKIQLKCSKKIKIKHYIINSKTNNREELLNIFHNLKAGVIFTTLVLERGITFKDAHVVVYRADHDLFSYENLVQIAGRVGRKKDYPHGDILFLVNKKNRNIKRAIRFIKKCNE